MVPKGEQATITKATVELVVVRVGSKQMTKAVFDQLPWWNREGDFFDTAHLWGWVYTKQESCVWLGDFDGILYRYRGAIGRYQNPEDIERAYERDVNRVSGVFLENKANELIRQNGYRSYEYPMSLAEAKACALRTIRNEAEKARKSAYRTNELFERTRDLPQLYIAV